MRLGAPLEAIRCPWTVHKASWSGASSSGARATSSGLLPVALTRRHCGPLSCLSEASPLLIRPRFAHSKNSGADPAHANAPIRSRPRSCSCRIHSSRCLPTALTPSRRRPLAVLAHPAILGADPGRSRSRRRGCRRGGPGERASFRVFPLSSVPCCQCAFVPEVVRAARQPCGRYATLQPGLFPRVHAPRCK